MARTRHLPLYAAIYAFCRETYRLKVKLPKTLKHDLGQEAFGSSIKMLMQNFTMGSHLISRTRSQSVSRRRSHFGAQRRGFSFLTPSRPPIFGFSAGNLGL